VDRAVDNLVKSGKLFASGSRRDALPPTTGGRPYTDHGGLQPLPFPLISFKTAADSGRYAWKHVPATLYGFRSFPLALGFESAEFLCFTEVPRSPD
jgi:hypothetical protein